MKRKAIGFAFTREGHADYNNPARFETRHGQVIGRVRHSANRYDGSIRIGCTLDETAEGEPYWHYHETDGVRHCTRSIHADDIIGVAS